MADNQFDWDSYLKSINPVSTSPNIDASNYSYENMAKTLSQGGRSFTEAAFPAVLPLLQPGVDPYLQQAIDAIVQQGQASKARTMSDISTDAMRRGIDVSSIVSGDLAQASTQAELGQQGQISSILAQSEQDKRNRLVNFLSEAYGTDINTANQLATTMAQLMGEQLNAKQTESMFGRNLDAQKVSREDRLFQMLNALIKGGGDAGSAAIIASAASDRRLKKNIKKIGEIKGINFYSFEYDTKKRKSLPTGTCIGVMADEVKDIPGVVSTDSEGYDMVNYTQLVDFLS